MCDLAREVFETVGLFVFNLFGVGLSGFLATES